MKTFESSTCQQHLLGYSNYKSWVWFSMPY